MNNDTRLYSQVSSISLQKNYIKDLREIGYQLTKRTFDIIVATFGLLFFLPILLCVKLAYVLSGDFSPVMFNQTRIGLNGKKFKLYKFRSMVPNANEVLKELLKEEKYKKEWDLYQKLTDDPRITKIGKLLRKTSLDEIPQVLNILSGDLSLIGPRPLVEGEIEKHNGNAKLYNSVRPGLTGWWAVNGRSHMEYQARLDLEYYYIKNKSIKLDVKVFFKTFTVLRTHEGAK